MSARRKVLLAIAATIGGFLLLCVACVGGTTVLSAVGVLPTPEPTIEATPRPADPAKPTPTPRAFTHDPTPRPSRTDRFVFLVRSAGYTNRADLVPPAGYRYLLLSVQVGPNRLADQKKRGGAVQEDYFRLVAGEQELAPDVAAREKIGARGFGNVVGTTIGSNKSERRTLVFLVPATEEHFRLRSIHGGGRPIEFTLRAPAGAPMPDAPLPPEGEGE